MVRTFMYFLAITMLAVCAAAVAVLVAVGICRGNALEKGKGREKGENE